MISNCKTCAHIIKFILMGSNGMECQKGHSPSFLPKECKDYTLETQQYSKEQLETFKQGRLL